MTISRWTICGMRIILDKSFGENQNKPFTFGNIFLKSWHLWDNVEKYGRGGQVTDGNIIQCLRFACLVTKATDTFWKYNRNCCYTATMVMRTRLSVTFIRTLPLLSTLLWWTFCQVWEKNCARLLQNTPWLLSSTTCSIHNFLLFNTYLLTYSVEQGPSWEAS